MRPVIWTPLALEELRSALRHIAKDSAYWAEKVDDRIKGAARALGDHSTGRPGKNAGTFEKSVPRTSHVLVYTIRSYGQREFIVILRMIHTARNWPR